MAKIHRMDEHLTNMIAAGEVVERPMGIVKECVENSIDAKASRIEVWITQGGIEQIEIYDNGTGMDKEDALMAFERHATSKIKTVQDLWSISTLGFRGEALPSIASVSHVELHTSNGNDSTRVIIDYGKLVTAEPYGCNNGTEIIVRGLFQKTPARLKHLRSAQYETALISDVMNKFAMSHPEIAFRLVVDGKETFKTTGLGQLKEVLYMIYGRDAAANCFPIEGEDFDSRIVGLGVLPHISRANRNYVTLFINQRMVRSFKITKAILDAYHRYMPEERFPIVILQIELDEQLIDVNVHPSKWEIRLSKEQQLVLLVKEAMEKCLEKYMQAPKVEKIRTAVRVEQPQLFEKRSPAEHLVKENSASYGKSEDTQSEGYRKPITEKKYPERALSEEEIKMLFPKQDSALNKEISAEKEFVKNSADLLQAAEIEKEEANMSLAVDAEEVKTEPALEEKPANGLPHMEPLAQLHGRYILASCDEGLVIIDQHAAQERANYERFLKLFEERDNPKTELLLPISLNASSGLVAQLETLNRMVQELGIEFEAFSENTLIVRAVPLWMQQLDERAFLQDVLDEFSQENNLSKAHLNKNRIATQACHHSIRFNRVLTREEMEQVIRDLENCRQPFHCPHGRPTMITITEAQLIKEFKR